ncbi:hypothetical protein STVA_08260 [Allostella vacuolata]|nr:hypothetical protein STVA_08260 [Stella vacuolata]
MRASWAIAGLAAVLAAGGCTGNSDLILERKGNELTVRMVEGDPGAAHRAAREACAADRKRAAVAAVGSDTLKFVCQPF